MEPTFMMVTELNEPNPFKAFTINVWHIGSAQYLLAVNIVNNLMNLTNTIKLSDANCIKSL